MFKLLDDIIQYINSGGSNLTITFIEMVLVLIKKEKSDFERAR